MERNIAEEVRKRFARIMKLDPAELDMNAPLGDAYGIDSLNSLRLISELEVSLGCDIPEEDIEKIRTLKDVVAICEAHSAL